MGGFIVYSLIITSGVVIGYAALVVLETNYGNRFASDFRLYLDQKLLALIQNILGRVQVVQGVYRKGSNAIENEIIDPIAKPIKKTKKRYDTLRTGKVQIRSQPLTALSPYLRKLVVKKRKK